jgi:hypothetical protein
MKDGKLNCRGKWTLNPQQMQVPYAIKFLQQLPHCGPRLKISYVAILHS